MELHAYHLLPFVFSETSCVSMQNGVDNILIPRNSIRIQLINRRAERKWKNQLRTMTSLFIRCRRSLTKTPGYWFWAPFHRPDQERVNSFIITRKTGSGRQWRSWWILRCLKPSSRKKQWCWVTVLPSGMLSKAAGSQEPATAAYGTSCHGPEPNIGPCPHWKDLCQRRHGIQSLYEILLSWNRPPYHKAAIHQPCKCGLEPGTADWCVEHYPWLNSCSVAFYALFVQNMELCVDSREKKAVNA